MGLALREFGALPILLLRCGLTNKLELEGYAKAVIRELDGLVMSAGADVSPQSYGESAQDPRWLGDPLRDAWEMALYHQAIAQQRPVLGICRGCQLLNVAEGGSLWQDVVTGIPGSAVHRSQTYYDGLTHEVVVDPKSELFDILGSQTVQVNSVHHQAIRKLGSGLQICARSSDGVVEAIWRTGTPWVLGVQWHPEWMLGNPVQQQVFARFIEQAARMRNDR
jgi:putative glutamine amidotransferase